ncbi:hypothetical protein [Lactobacillus johnsonii]|uniref:hypothetical protein n=1 Tax=Lactobacillus johnsonii TaxID=33959 RepID=UPI002B2615BB|nr:hypothetical protein [Lactobacillus johnsonii]
MGKVRKWFDKYEGMLIPVIVAFLSLVPIKFISDKLTIVLWTLIVGIIYDIVLSSPVINITFNKKGIDSKSDITINLSPSSTDPNEIHIKISPYKILKREHRKNLKIVFPR